MKMLFTTSLALVLFSYFALGQSSTDTQPGSLPSQNQTSSQPAPTQSAAGAASGSANDANAAHGLTIGAILDKTIDAKKAKEGDPVVAKTTVELKSANGQVIPRNSKVIGHVTQVQARGKGQDQSTLGIVFEKIQPGKDQELPFHAVIQALAPPPPVTLIGDSGAGPSSPGAAGSGGTAGSAGAAGAAPRGSTGSGSMAGNAGAPPSAAGEGAPIPSQAAGAPLNENSQGAIGMKNVQLTPAESAGAPSILTSTSANVRLESGTRLVLHVTPQ